MREFLKKINLHWSDLLMVVGFAPFCMCLLYGIDFINHPNPNDIIVPLWLPFVCFGTILISWLTYIFLNYKKGIKTNRYILIAFLFTIAIGIISVAVQPSAFEEYVIVKAGDVGKIGDVVRVALTISPIHYTFFIFQTIVTILFVYIGFFVLPKRFSGIASVRFFNYLFLIYMAVMVISSYIMEFNNYIGFFKYIFGNGNPDDTIYTYTVKSFVGHRNVYGMILMAGIVFALTNHAIEKKWYYYLIAGWLFISMLFSVCKTSILISFIIILIYLIYRLVVTYKEHQKRNKIIIICGFSLIFALILPLCLALFSGGKILNSLYTFFTSLGGSYTLETRSYIWGNSFQLLRGGWWLIGRGFCLFNEMLYPMNAVNGDPTFPAHCSYITLLGEGGIVFLLGYVALLIYVAHAIIKCYRRYKELSLIIALGIVAFIIYSFIENVHYLVYVFSLMILMAYHALEEKEKADIATSLKDK